MKIHHVGYLAKSIAKSEKKFLELGYEIERPVKFDEIRNINIEFLVNGDYRVELIEPMGEDSPMYPLLARYKNTPYHFCYEVEDIDKAVEELSAQRYTVIHEPNIAPCIDGKKVAFLYNNSMGIIELVEF
ncbi:MULTISPECIES: VOC family protein [unclassified Butyrivibrio]|uniref:VOC family protein n=1 Tax=unclassified Butyrivibrio TaxID=2639466 RepID=UPI0008E2CD1B|nr:MULTISPECIES: VOC family protein [unclassified Butyrivibrio]RKM54293.1 VOC family protein [Butyrivibrio sp. X503]SFU67043.1 methylmalonyl-CoA/ethylmalonyl-CoA epimerase [Butyrivibrio sp. INlla21]